MMPEVGVRIESFDSPDLKAGDWVVVRPAQEILAMLHNDRKTGGIAFTPEMAAFCGKAFRISKKVTKMILESTGELRTLKMPTVSLEGVFCNGKIYGECDRSCFYLWLEAWLKKAPFPPSNKKQSELELRECSLMTDTPGHCQAYFPDLAQATLPDTRSVLWLRRYWWRFKRDLWHLSVLGPFGFASRTFFLRKLEKAIQKRERDPIYPAKKAASLNLQPGDSVEVKSLKEIFATLDRQGKLNGMRFEKEQAKFSGGRFKVAKRVDRIISEADGKLLRAKTPTVLLEEVFCDGKAHAACDRYCFLFWREEWLKRV